MQSITTMNPADGQIIARYPVHRPEEITQILSRAEDAQRNWKTSAPGDRIAGLLRLASLLRRDKLKLAALVGAEMGKSEKEAEAEVEKCSNCAEFYSQSGPAFLRSQEIKTEAHRSLVAFEPLGVVFAIMPWNFPLWQALRCAIPAIFAGNTVVLKHASNVTGSAQAIAKLVAESFGRDDLLQILVIAGAEAEKIIGRKEISAVSFTGSTEVGRRIAAAAGQHLKKSVLELGGSDPYVVLADADVELAAQVCAKSRLINSGQSCISAKRFIVAKSVMAEFTEKFMKNLRTARLAPLARADLREELQALVDKSVRRGAKLLCGGEIPVGPGFHYPATVLGEVKPGMAAFEEETFGPVAALVAAETDAHAIELANQTVYGLGAAVFTRDLAKGEKIAIHQLLAGSCFVNDLVRSDPRLPFGGIKESGFGRELSDFGIREFTNIKTIYISN
jgi:succinate-semialdehyde dehydrogenase / glutarate-semialdehyde dehydrogenase